MHGRNSTGRYIHGMSMNGYSMIERLWRPVESVVSLLTQFCAA